MKVIIVGCGRMGAELAGRAKAVIGIAFRHLAGEILHHSNFSGGDEHTLAWVLDTTRTAMGARWLRRWDFRRCSAARRETANSSSA